MHSKKSLKIPKG